MTNAHFRKINISDYHASALFNKKNGWPSYNGLKTIFKAPSQYILTSYIGSFSEFHCLILISDLSTT